MARPRILLALRRPLAMFGDGERTDVGKRLTRPRAEPQIMIEEEIRRHHDPEHAAARLLHQLEADLDLVGLAADDFGLELDMAGCENGKGSCRVVGCMSVEIKLGGVYSKKKNKN